MKKNTESKSKTVVGFTCGSFDLCHTGHMMMFREIRRRCDYLIVGLQEDPSKDRPEKNRPIMSISERHIILDSVKYIDEIVIYKTEKDLEKLLIELMPNIRFIGEDWKDKEYTGKHLPIKVAFNSRKHSYSTTNLRERIYKAEVERMSKEQ